MKTAIKLTSFVLLSALSCSVASAAFTTLETTTTYTGSGPLIDVNYDEDEGKGRIDEVYSNSWDTELPSASNPGLFDGRVGDGTAGLATKVNGWAWYGVAVRQTGGALSDLNLAMRGGDELGANGFQSIFEIDDASNTGFGTKNLAISGMLSLWQRPFQYI